MLAIPEHGSHPSVWSIHPVRLLWRNSSLLCRRLPIGDGFWVKDSGMCPVPLSALGAPTWLELVQALCVLPQPQGVHVCVSLLCWRFLKLYFLVSSIPSGYYSISVSYSASFPELRGKASDESHLGPSVPNISHSVHVAQLYDSVSVSLYCKRKLV